MPRLLPRPETALATDEPSPERDVARPGVHPWAWWAWALGCAALGNLTANPAILALLGLVLVAVVLRHRGSAAWRRGLTFHVILAVFILVMRLVFRIVLGSAGGGPVLFSLPELQLPDWAAGIRLGGAFTSGELQETLTDGMRLSVLILAVGAANCLADPRSALRSVPAALHDISVAVVITLTVLPQLISSAARVTRGRRLRGRPGRGVRALIATIVPVLEDAVEGAMALATSMEARGYGRTRDQQRVGWAARLVLLLALVMVTLGVFWLLGVAPGQRMIGGLALSQWVSFGLLGSGVVLGVLALARSGRRLAVSRYRPQPWGSIEWVLLLLAVSLVLVTVVLSSPWGMPGAIRPTGWPEFTWPVLALPALAMAPILLRGVDDPR